MPIDSRWYQQLLEITVSADTTWLRDLVHVPKYEQERFLEHKIENPRFVCDTTTSQREKISALHALRALISREETNPYIYRLYIDKIDAHLTRLMMFECTRVGDDIGFFEHSVTLYGAPKKSFFSYVAHRIHAQVSNMQVPSSHRDAQLRMLAITSKISMTHDIVSPDMLPEISETDGIVISAEETKDIFLKTLMNYEIDGWSVRIDPRRRIFSVHSQHKCVYIPPDSALRERKILFTETRARALAEHEIGVHVRRAHEGAKQSLKLLEYGLAGYLRGEEGLAGYAQQQIERSSEFYGFDRYFALSLAVGLDGTPRDFRSVFECMVDYYTLTRTHDSHTHARAEQLAWEVCARIFRGTTGQCTGLVFTRDIVYLEGNVGIWNLLVKNPHLYSSLFIGKYDPLNEAQVTTLQALEILPQW